MALVLDGSIDRIDVSALCARVRVLLEAGDVEPLVCDVSRLIDPDAATIEALARLQLTARRLGRRVRLLHASVELQELLVLTGLSSVLPFSAGLGPEPSGKPEEGEQRRRVQEEADPGDPIP